MGSIWSEKYQESQQNNSIRSINIDLKQPETSKIVLEIIYGEQEFYPSIKKLFFFTFCVFNSSSHRGDWWLRFWFLLPWATRWNITKDVCYVSTRKYQEVDFITIYSEKFHNFFTVIGRGNFFNHSERVWQFLFEWITLFMSREIFVSILVVKETLDHCKQKVVQIKKCI